MPHQNLTFNIKKYFGLFFRFNCLTQVKIKNENKLCLLHSLKIILIELENFSSSKSGRSHKLDFVFPPILHIIQKQPLQTFYKKDVLKNFAEFTRNTCWTIVVTSDSTTKLMVRRIMFYHVHLFYTLPVDYTVLCRNNW